MLVKVKSSKLTLGRTVYHKGDVFECRDSEARLLKAAGHLENSSPKGVPTKEAPKSLSTGVSLNPNKPARPPRTERAHKPSEAELKALSQKNEPSLLEKAKADHAAQRRKAAEEEKSKSSAVGAMSLPSDAAPVTVPPVAGAPANSTPAIAPSTAARPFTGNRE